MKLHSSRETGNTLIVVMMITGLIIAALGSYLNLTSQEHKTLRRSLCWNAALPLAEAGIEEALSQLDQNKTNFAADGWTTNYTKQRWLGDDYYIVNFAGKPGSTVTICSTGFVHVIDDKYISRTVMVRGITAKDFKFPGLVASAILFGGNFSADSYDSSDPSASTGGAYDPAKAGAQALIATPGPGFNMGGNSHIHGYVASGPGGSVTVSGSASVGDLNFRGKGIQPGHSTNNFTVSMPSAQEPYQEADMPVANVVNGTNYDYVLDGGQYLITNLTSTVYGGSVYVKGTSMLYVTDLIVLNKVTFEPGARLDLYVASPNITFAPVVFGATAPQFTVFALPSCRSLTLNGGTLFTGLIYAPDTVLSASGTAEVAGAIAANTFNCLGTFIFHYDLAFSKPRVLPPVKILSWAEL